MATDLTYGRYLALDQLLAANPPTQLQQLLIYHIVATKIAQKERAN